MIGSLIHFFRSLLDELSRPLNLALAFFVSILPRRYWRGARGPGIALSAFIQLGASLAGLVEIYTGYSQIVSDDLANITVEAALETEAQSVSAAPAMAFGALTPLGFFAVSNAAWFLSYGVLSGLIRLVGYASDHPCGDPVLTFVDEVLWDTGRGIASSVRRTIGVVGSWWRR